MPRSMHGRIDVTALGRRRLMNLAAALLGLRALSACGGGGAAAADSIAAGPASPPAPPPPAAPAPSPPPAPTPPAAGATLTTLRVTATRAGTLPFGGTVLPLQGQVPQNSTLVSPDDPSLAGSVVSRWPDGSASVVVLAGVAAFATNETRTLRIQAQPATAAPGLGAARVSQLLTSVAVELGALGRAELSNFSQPERLWWANARTVCARYRLALPGAARLEAVIDVQAFDSPHALVEVVIENGSMNSAAPVKPAAAAYAAQVLVNGNVIGSADTAAAPEGQHTAFRAWYAAGWIGGDPGTRCTQAHADLQAHPLFFKCDRAGGDMAVYANDVYVPFGPGRQRATYMGAGGDHPSIGPLPLWEARFLQTGDPRAARAVEANALAVLGFNINYRDSTSGLVPNFEQLSGRSMQINWPYTINAAQAMTWEVAHHPAAGLMAFVARPSPVFIEIAQKVAVWNGTWSTTQGIVGGGSGTGLTGVFGGPYQGRGKAWCLRSLAHATFLTPDSMAWKAAGRASIAANVAYIDVYRTSPRAALGAVWGDTPSFAFDLVSSQPGFQQPLWYHHYLTTELHKLAAAGMLTGAQQAALNALADWCALQPARWVNEQANGGWRHVPYLYTLGRDPTSVDSLPDYAQQSAWAYIDSPPAVSGSWMSDGARSDSYAAGIANTSAGAFYPSYLWAALVAAVERRVEGASTAWATVNTQIVNLSAWRDGFAADPRWGATPRSN